MCDTYSAKCAGRGCETYLEVHIGGLSTPRRSVKAYCPACAVNLTPRQKARYIRKFVDTVEHPSQVWIYDGDPTTRDIGVPGQRVFIGCTDKRGHHIHLN